MAVVVTQTCRNVTLCLYWLSCSLCGLWAVWMYISKLGEGGGAL